jgi:hypothetical protein
MKIKIKVTKDVLKRSQFCGRGTAVSTNCAIAVASQEFFPGCAVTYDTMGEPIIRYLLVNVGWIGILLPPIAERFMKTFDESHPKQRITMPESAFEIEVPEEVIQSIGISEAYRILSESKTLELVGEFKNP